MTAENYKKYLLNEKENGRSVPQPLKDEDRLAIWKEVFSEDKEVSKKKK